MTFNDLLAQIPKDKRDYEVDFNVQTGLFPSGEEGAEDWIMSASLQAVDIRDEQKVIYLDILYS